MHGERFGRSLSSYRQASGRSKWSYVSRDIKSQLGVILRTSKGSLPGDTLSNLSNIKLLLKSRRMHHALEIQEILLNVFDQCCSFHLPALARTCRAFKEPALDVLWENLDDLSPLVGCIPEGSRTGEASQFQVFAILCLIMNPSHSHVRHSPR